ncbi:transferrin receptor 1a [Pimephales promelas]|uniref:transferrin receptor 1a n=1 Tax=Pimephales promelas TaxID=90988 RepID=UPI0019554F31|nr:transferrin receptor 1a [Pimephales promelas]XP_039528001.1 transferrin receptor 1a [Pimephales promelas]XP_039528002.1 transferrin receptor 1a [Pimephales promelas]XP_039528003.1 transferrin receptor 1a [Pimephales promelas]
MEQARTTISKIFNGEPRSYTRFNLTQNMEGDNSHVEMKLSSDMDDEVEANGGGESIHQHNRPYYPSKLNQRSPKTVCGIVTAILFLFIIGYLIGYLSNRSTDKNEIKSDCPVYSETTLEKEQPVYSLDWSDLRALLKKKLTTGNIESNLKEFSSVSHQAGSSGDEMLANKVMGKFRTLGMNPWTDEHFVKVQDRGTSNKVLFRGNSVGTTEGYLAYSAVATVEGAALYAHYGRAEDFSRLQEMNVDVNGKVVLIRAGLLSFAEKVANAASLNASAVLIYPDPDNNKINENTALFGHVHLGTGDPYTPGFPSFNHTQFPPAESSGLPLIPAQTITIKQATEIISKLRGRLLPVGWSPEMFSDTKFGDEGDNITVEVNNVLVQKKIHNVFGVIKGYLDPDRYMVIGAQRDAWGPGFARSTVGTSLLVELARAITDMIKNDGFKPKRSIVFASWSAGEFGSVGATEWLEGYLTSLNLKTFSYISLDEVISGSDSFKASASPLLYDLLESTMKQVSHTTDATKSLHEQFAGSSWEKSVMEPMGLSHSAYPFQSFSGIPSLSFRFTSGSVSEYPFGTYEDTKQTLDRYTSSSTVKLAKTAGEVAGLVTLRLVHDHLLKLNVAKYTNVIRNYVSQIRTKVESRQMVGRLPSTLTMQWLLSAQGSYDRAASALVSTIRTSDLDDMEQCRIINNRIMRVEGSLLSPYVSPRERPFRHIILGSGSHTLAALVAHLDAIRGNLQSADVDQFRNEFAFATWTIQGCANALAGEVWDMDNEI